MDNNKVTFFTVEGGFIIPENFQPVTDCNGEICGYKTPKGETVKLVIALEVESPEGELNYIASEKAMDDVGFECLEYSKAVFENAVLNLDTED